MLRIQYQIGMTVALIVFNCVSHAEEPFAYVADNEDKQLAEKTMPPVAPADSQAEIIKVGPPASAEADPLKGWENPDQFDAYLVPKGANRETAKVIEQSKKLQKRFKSAEDGAPMVITTKKRGKKSASRQKDGRAVGSITKN